MRLENLHNSNQDCGSIGLKRQKNPSKFNSLSASQCVLITILKRNEIVWLQLVSDLNGFLNLAQDDYMIENASFYLQADGVKLDANPSSIF